MLSHLGEVTCRKRRAADAVVAHHMAAHSRGLVPDSHSCGRDFGVGVLLCGEECLPDAESAFYFSGVTYATIGYGDLVWPTRGGCWVQSRGSPVFSCAGCPRAFSLQQSCGSTRHVWEKSRNERYLDAMEGDVMIKKIGIITGGGDCPGLNTVIRPRSQSQPPITGGRRSASLAGLVGCSTRHSSSRSTTKRSAACSRAAGPSSALPIADNSRPRPVTANPADSPENSSTRPARWHG